MRELVAVVAVARAAPGSQVVQSQGMLDVVVVSDNSDAAVDVAVVAVWA